MYKLCSILVHHYIHHCAIRDNVIRMLDRIHDMIVASPTCSKDQLTHLLLALRTSNRSADGDFQANFPCSIIFPIFKNCWNTGYPLNITFIFDRCQPPTPELFMCSFFCSIHEWVVTFCIILQYQNITGCWDFSLAHWGRDKMNDIFQMTFSNAFSWLKMFEFRKQFDWRFFLRV